MSSTSNPIGFLSYVRSDDDHDNGRITRLRERIQGEIRIQLGKEFPIFQDRNDILWGQNWEERIKQSIQDVTFFFPIITPSFFESSTCRMEFESFELRERQIGINRLIMPIYYVTCDQLGSEYQNGDDNIADILRARNYEDWRDYRFKELFDPTISKAIANMAKSVKMACKEVESELQAGLLSDTGIPETTTEKSSPKRITDEAVVVTKDTFKNDILETSKKKITSKELAEHSYYVYTKKYDEEVVASEMITASELQKLARFASKFASRYEDDFSSMWQKIEKLASSQKSDTSISILIDNSGSMRGEKIKNIVAWTTLFAEGLEQLDINFEILGFTTRAWKGGMSRESWLKNKKPTNPGRLNDLRHIIYKDFQHSWREASLNISLMMREGLLKENIDGEALLWAAERIEKTSSEKKLIIVLSDGAPVDDSTIAVSNEKFLPNHLHQTIACINKKSKIQIFGIGIEYNASEYYKNSASTSETNSLGNCMIQAMLSIFDSK